MNCAVKYATMEAKTAGPKRPNTRLKVSESIGDHLVCGSASDNKITPITKTEATSPAMTTWSAFFLPYNSESKSVTKNVMGYGNMPTEISKVYSPKGVHVKNF